MPKKQLDLQNIGAPALALDLLASRAALHQNKSLSAPQEETTPVFKTLGTPRLPENWKYEHPLRAKETSDPLFLRQIEVLYLRANLEKSRLALEAQGHPAHAVRQAITVAIERAYPHLVGVHDTPPVSEPNPPLLSRTTLKEERGWTESLLKRFLPEADHLKVNPMFRSAAPMQLYVLPRIEEIEASADFRAAFEVASKRRPAAQQAARKAADTKRQRMLAYVEMLRVKVPVFPEDKLLGRAISHYNDRDLRGKAADETSDPTFLGSRHDLRTLVR